SANKLPAGRLADLLPYDELAGALLATAAQRRAAAAQALLLGRAGLVPEAELPVPGGLLRAWAALDTRGPRRLPGRAWRRAGPRPAVARRQRAGAGDGGQRAPAELPRAGSGARRRHALGGGLALLSTPAGPAGEPRQPLHDRRAGGGLGCEEDVARRLPPTG